LNVSFAKRNAITAVIIRISKDIRCPINGTPIHIPVIKSTIRVKGKYSVTLWSHSGNRKRGIAIPDVNIIGKKIALATARVVRTLEKIPPKAKPIAKVEIVLIMNARTTKKGFPAKRMSNTNSATTTINREETRDRMNCTAM
jgi:hypothetical protein